MERIVFGIIGGGWRAEFYLRIARELPERFQVSRMLVRDAQKGKAIEDGWGIPTYRRLDSFLAEADFSFVVVSVGWESCPDYIRWLTERGIPVLAETPPAPDEQGLKDLFEAVGADAPVQVAEQYLFQPQHAAAIATVKSGKLGEVTQAQVSAAHGYHGISLIRQLLGIRFEEAEISAQQFVSPIVKGPDRSGPPQTEEIHKSRQDIAILRFNSKLAVFDFTGEQYFSWIRRNRMLVRGDRGEIVNDEIAYLHDFQTPVFGQFRRAAAGENGNLEGLYLKGILLEGEWMYRNPFIPGRLSDDEIAIATSLQKMAKYVQGGPSFYSLAEASQDHYLSLVLQRAVETGSTLTTVRQPWASVQG